LPDLFFAPSPQQRAFFDFAEKASGHCALEACAGSGKTTTLVKAAPRMRGTKFMGAFNKTIADELGRAIRIEDPRSHTVTAATLHSAGFTTWRQKYPKSQLMQDKLRRLCREILVQARNPSWEKCSDYACTMVGLAQRSGIGLIEHRDLQDDKQWSEVSARFDADRLLPEGRTERSGIQLAQRLMQRSLENCPEALSFDEMLYAPIHFGCRVTRYDNVLIDEAQDSSVPRIELASRMLAEGGRLFAVGDRHQAIYGFAGADAYSMETIIQRFGCTVLPLSVSYRCPEHVVLFAQQFVGLHIEAAPGAQAGVVRRSLDPGWATTENLGSTDAILCRFNAPLVEKAFEFLRRGVPCRMLGRDLGATLKSLAVRWDSRTIDQLEANLRDWLANETRLAALRDKPDRAESARDTVATMNVIIGRCRSENRHSIEDLIAEIGRLFRASDQPSLVLSSIHRAKGKEWPRVFWLRKRLRYARQEWQQRQEDNLDYVAATRAQKELVLIDDRAEV
jgi:DNA helicase-2/ATP-dependent DNA helicase PcrA